MTKPLKLFRELYLFSKKKEPLVEDWFSQNLTEHIELDGYDPNVFEACHWFTCCLEEFDIHPLHATRVINFSLSGLPFALLAGFDAILQINGVLTTQKVKSFFDAICDLDETVELLEESVVHIKKAQRHSGFSAQRSLKDELKKSRKNAELAFEAAKSAQALMYSTFKSTFGENFNDDDL